MLADNINALLLAGDRFMKGSASEFMGYTATATNDHVLAMSLYLFAVTEVDGRIVDFKESIKKAKNLIDVCVDISGKSLKSQYGIPNILDEYRYFSTSKTNVVATFTNEVYTTFAICFSDYANGSIKAFVCLLDDLKLTPITGG